jgi:hypothetical protein
MASVDDVKNVANIILLVPPHSFATHCFLDDHMPDSALANPGKFQNAIRMELLVNPAESTMPIYVPPLSQNF